ncbi:PKD domain-containing protein [Pseudoluteimonas lycopersici]|uniref:Neutral metalloproteinase n=2 Tax=Pseudoluteimonas lycopersici TaxID=1324796 RepID=A0A516V8L8_9GAMM|nr:PKD domain-containing protein [Lysobacter lycopersici]
MAAGRQDLHQANLAQLQSHYNSLVAAKGVSSMAHTRHEQLIGADADSRLVLMYRDTSHGVRNTRYQQTFRGIPVYGESIVVSEDAASGKLRTLFGRQVTGLSAEIADAPSKVFKGQALAIAKQAALGARLGAMRTSNEKSELMIYVDDAGHAHKAYVVNFFADSALAGNKPTRPYVIVDADSGKVLKQWEGLTTALIGTGPGGNEKTGQYEYGTDYGFMDVTQSGSTCTMNNSEVKTVDLNHGTSGSTAFSYTCPRHTGDSVNGGYSPLNDAHYFGSVIQNMYNAYVGTNALTFQLVMRVHYSTNYENAFWDGSTMNFGDGRNTFYPLVSVDVAGHEVSHGFTEQHSGLCYANGSDCGGMNEAYSDIAGEAAEYYFKGSNDFLVGEEIFKGASGQALRYMCNPPQDGISIDNAADMTRRINPHYSSGVYNKAFCTLAKTSGWDTPKAFKIFARANANYWTASSSFDDGACGVKTAATDLGYTTTDQANIDAAFNVVGVSCSGGGTNTPPVASFTIKTQGKFVQVTSTSTDSDGTIVSVKWDSGDGRTSTKTPLTYKYASSGTYTVTLTVTDDDGATNSTSKSVTIP